MATDVARCYTPKQVADKFGLSLRHVERLCRTGEINAKKPTKGRWSIPQAEVDRMEQAAIKGEPANMPRIDAKNAIKVKVENAASPFLTEGHRSVIPGAGQSSVVEPKQLIKQPAKPGEGEKGEKEDASSKQTNTGSRSAEQPKSSGFPIRFKFLGS